MTEVVLLDVADGVATVTMNRPEVRNALNAELRSAVEATMADLDADDTVAAIVLTGADPAFCAGLDLAEISSGRSEAGAAAAVLGRRGPWDTLSTPVIGAINGPAVTGGFEYALACDFLIASERARFADTHARVGIQPGWGLTVRLAEAVGQRRARQMSFTGNYVDAATALTWGLVNEVVRHDELLDRAVGLARDVAGIDRRAIAYLKETYELVGDSVGQDAWDHEGRRSVAWMEGFDPADLAHRRADIQARGRAQVT